MPGDCWFDALPNAVCYSWCVVVVCVVVCGCAFSCGWFWFLRCWLVGYGFAHIVLAGFVGFVLVVLCGWLEWVVCFAVDCVAGLCLLIVLDSSSIGCRLCSYIWRLCWRLFIVGVSWLFG